jgi:hypothetical protein
MMIHHRRQREEAIDDGCQDDEHHDVERHGDAIQRVAHHPLEDPPRFLDAFNDRGKAGRGQDQRRRRARGIRGAGDRDAYIGLFQSRRVVDTISRHANDLAALLQGLDDSVFVLGEDPRESVCRIDMCGYVR